MKMRIFSQCAVHVEQNSVKGVEGKPDEARAYFVIRQGKMIRALCEHEGAVLEGTEAVRAMLRWRYITA